MLFVGHVALAFLMVFLASLIFPNIKKCVSIALVMFLSILPDIDIVFRIVGTELGHRTFTHSAIIWLTIGGILVCLPTKGYLKTLIAIYVISYVSHIIVGDALIGPINIIYPLGDLLVVSPIKAWSWPHMAIEAGLVALMTVIVIRRYRTSGTTSEQIFPFCYYRRLDAFLYPVLLSALAVSLFYVLNESEITSSLFASEDVANKVVFLILIHSAALFVTILIWWLAWKNTRRRVSYHF